MQLFSNVQLAQEVKFLILKHKHVNVHKINIGMIKDAYNAIYQNILILKKKNVYIAQQVWLLIFLKKNVQLVHLKLHGLMELNVLNVYILVIGIKLSKIV